MRVVMMIEGQEGVTWAQWRALAAAAEQAGLDGLFRSDHYTGFHGFGEGALDAWATIAGLAAVTKTLRLGALVSPVTFRPPSLIARMVVTADHISGGRAELGLGTGWHEGEHKQNGFPFPPQGARTQMLAEQVEIVTKSWSGERFDFNGAHYILENQQALPKPVQRALPLILGGRGGPKSLALAARFAAEYNAFASGAEEIAKHRANMDEACKRIGRDPASLVQSTMTMAVLGQNEADAIDRSKRLADRAGPKSMFGTATGRLRADGWIGAPDKIAEKLRGYEKAGVQRVFVQNFDFDDLSAVALLGELQRALV